uniref:Uncharacterized protein n=1 Tax=Talaromyces marneffei PM1 TaxID=1077442 RepID=A0A093UYK6_TALMA
MFLSFHPFRPYLRCIVSGDQLVIVVEIRNCGAAAKTMAHVFDAIVPERLTQANNRHSLNEVTSPSATTQQNALRTSPKIDTPQPEADSAIYLQPQSWDPMISGIQTDNFSTTMDDLFSFLGPPLESNGHDLLQGFLDQSTTPSAGPEVYPPTPRDSAQQSPGEDKSVSSLESSYPKDTLSALSRLNHFLTECHLLLQNQSCPPPWRISMPYLNLPNDSKLDENPVGLLLRSTAEFIDIVRTWTKSTSKQPTESEKTKDRNSPTKLPTLDVSPAFNLEGSLCHRGSCI